MLPRLDEIESARAVIRPYVPETPCYRWPLLEKGCEVWMKHENHSPVGAFKLRGGLVYMDELCRTQPQVRGVIAATTGNHGQSIAFAARQAGLRALIVVPHGNNPEKNAAMRSLGAELVEHGADFQEALEHSRVLAEFEGLHPVPSFHPWLVRGVATYGLEMFCTAPPLEAVFVPIGLGSGLCGVAAARAALGVSCAIVGVVSAHAPAYALSLENGRLTEHPSSTSVAEGVACKTPNADALQIILHECDHVVQVTDEEALAAMRAILMATHNLPEGSGALSYAALCKEAHRWQDRRVACVLSGGNVSMHNLSRCLAGSTESGGD